jgi:acyl-CoA thioesterase-1
VVNAAKPNSTVDAVVPAIPDLIAKSGAKLVIWAPGGRDAVRRPNPNEFFTELEAGIAAVRQSGADLILLDMQYVPILEQLSRIEEYRDLLRGAASANDVPLVQRHELMRVWSDDGTLDLGATDTGVQTEVTRKLFACMARVLADPIAAAVR